MKKLHVRKDDEVVVISGNDKGKRGKVISVSPSEGKVLVSGVHMVKKHQKPRRQGEAGQILEVEGAIYARRLLFTALSATQVAAARLPSARTARKSEYALSAAQSFNRR